MVITSPTICVKILLPLAAVQLQPSEHCKSPAKSVPAPRASESLGSTEAKQTSPFMNAYLPSIPYVV